MNLHQLQHQLQHVLCFHQLLPLVLIIVSIVLSIVRGMVGIVVGTISTCYTSQRGLQKPVEHLRWRFLQKQLTGFSTYLLIIFAKNLHRRCQTRTHLTSHIDIRTEKKTLASLLIFQNNSYNFSRLLLRVLNKIEN